MEKTPPDGYGLAAVIGLTQAQVVTLIQQANTAEDPVYLGNVNSPEQALDSKGLMDEQCAAFEHTLTSRDLVMDISGTAGAGKTHLLKQVSKTVTV